MLLKSQISSKELRSWRACGRVMVALLCAGGLAACENLAELGSELRQTYERTLESIDKSLAENQEGKTEKPSERTNEVVVLDRRGMKRLQAQLKKLGFKPGPVDGIYGGQTAKAIKNYQSAFALPVSTKITSNFLDHIEAMSDHRYADRGSPGKRPQQKIARSAPEVPPDPEKASASLTAEDLPTYLAGTTFLYSNGKSERVTGSKDNMASWAQEDGSTYRTHRNFLLPKSYWSSGNERGSAKISGVAEDLWPARRGVEVSFYAKITQQQGNDPASTKRRVDQWRCRNDGEKTITVEAGTFDTLVLVCRRGEDSDDPDFVRTWYYSKAVRHFVRLIEDDRLNEKEQKIDLVAVRPGALSWPPIVRAALARALVHALEKKGGTAQMPWTSSGVNTNVTIEAKSRFTYKDGQACRRFVQIWSEKGQHRHYPAVACKNNSGKWAIPGLGGKTANSLATTGGLS